MKCSWCKRRCTLSSVIRCKCHKKICLRCRLDHGCDYDYKNDLELVGLVISKVPAI